jgi:hypothetical protein
LPRQRPYLLRLLRADQLLVGLEIDDPYVNVVQHSMTLLFDSSGDRGRRYLV